ncbi:MAG TPA: methyltransferase domain-containing protein [Patescibacteria group bacterium]|nr:methyltransferase domain-containing protein [Patescibacteria group bacterium]
MTGDPVRAQWAAVAEHYGAGWSHADGPDLRWLVDVAAPRPADRAIDLGAGAGHATLALAPHVARVDAIDPTPEMLTVAARLAGERGIVNVAWIEGRADAIPYPAATFDIAISRFSIHHWPDPPGALREVARVLRPGGRIVLIDLVSPENAGLDTFLNAVELLRDPTHGRSLRPSDWRAALDGAGFRGEIAREWRYRQDTESWLARAAPPAWRADAVRRMLREAPDAARAAFEIAADGSGFTVGAVVVAGALPG